MGRYRHVSEKMTEALNALQDPHLSFPDAIRMVVSRMLEPLKRPSELGQPDAEKHRAKVLSLLDTSAIDAEDPMVKRDGRLVARACQLSPDEVRELIDSIRWLEQYLASVEEEED